MSGRQRMPASPELKFRPGTNQLRCISRHRVLDDMPGASEQTQQVKIVNANWVPGPDGEHGRFEIMFVTEDDQRHVAAPSPEAMTALIALTQADTVLAWDPADRTLIIANIVGTMPWTQRAQPGPPGRCQGRIGLTAPEAADRQCV
jgi:hypothetical protein